jgi:sugar transferase (PEP-CTERM system associated)
VIRIFNVHYPKRAVLLVSGEALILFASFMFAAVLRIGHDSSRLLNEGYGLYGILAVPVVALLCMYCVDLYDGQRVSSTSEINFRLLVTLGVLSLLLALVGYLFPKFLLGGGVFVTGLFITTIALLSWRAGYAWLVRKVDLRQRIYLLGDGDRGRRIAEAIRTRDDLGMRLVGWAGSTNGLLNRETLSQNLRVLASNNGADGVIVALAERRATMPVQELLTLRLRGIKVEDGTGVLEKISGKIDVDELYPSWLIFSDGFRINSTVGAIGRAASIMVSSVLLVLVLPVIPFVALAIKLTSPGPVLYRQKRVGQGGAIFNCCKFRTMRADAEADIGATWASDDDPRITPVGLWLRRTRLDEIPQLWNVLRGDMNLCGPRPERPEFVEWLRREIPYYDLRHIVRPGVTGWAQVKYPYGSTVEDAKEKLTYDLFYIKNLSLGLDIAILLRTVKVVLWGRGAK